MQCLKNQMKNVCNMLKLEVYTVANVHAMSHGARNGGCRLVAEICVVEVSPKCCSQIHKRYVLIKVKTGGLYET